MKNLMNRVLVVLAISAVFAGSMDAVQRRTNRRAPAKRTAKRTATAMSAGQRALSNLRHKSRGNFRVYTVALRKADAATLRNEVPNAKNAIATLENASLITDDAKRSASFTSGVGMKAAATVAAIMMNEDLKDATEELKENPTPANIAKVEEKQAEVAAAVVQLDEEAGDWKSYATAKNALRVTLGAAALYIAYAYGLPYASAAYTSAEGTEFGKNYLVPTRERLSGYAGTVSGYVSPVIDSAKGYAQQAAQATGLSWLKNKASNMYYGNQDAGDTLQNEGNKMVQEGEKLINKGQELKETQ